MEKRYDHKISEKEAQERWLTENTYKHDKHPGEVYSIDTPPPTVSGSLHIGHIFSYTQTDIIARYKRMNGYSVFYPFGFDDNGLPTERYVEKKRKVSAHALGRSAFIQEILSETAIVEKQFQDLWQRMGLSADWDATYSTISPEVRKISQESFIRLYEKGFIYRKYEPAPYCPTCRTSVAQAELDDSELPSHFNDIIFTLEDGTPLIIGTTRPELLYSVGALLYHPDDVRYQHLKGKKAIVPLYNHAVPIYPDVMVEIEKGTGLVMVSTFGDKTDIIWYKKHNLPYRPSLEYNGKFKEETGVIAGMKAGEARKRIIEELQKHDLIKHQKAITHHVSVHERCKKEIEYIALSQWFLNILEHKEKFLENADAVEWFPKFMKSRYINWVENISWDWCLSRQRFYGIPFPAWHCTQCDAIILANVHDLPIDPQENPYTKPCPDCGSNDVVPDTDVMDTWNTSSLTPYICANLFNNDAQSPFDNPATQQFIPMSMRPQAHDIIRTWAFYTIVKTWMHSDKIPWKDIVISGHVLSDSKEKLSKSKNNNKLAPEKLLETYPADVIRYWTASGSLGHDVSFSETQLKIGQKLVTKLWNAFRFVKEHIEQAEISEQAPSSIGMINEWLLHAATLTDQAYTKQLNAYEFSAALDAVERFFWHDFCDNYLEMVKDQLFNPDKYDPKDVAGTRWTLYTVGLRILQWYAAYLPHITEKIYQEIFAASQQKLSLHTTKFTDIPMNYQFEESTRVINGIIQVVSDVRKFKTERQLSLRTPLKKIGIYTNDDTAQEALKKNEQLIKGVTTSEQVVVATPAESEPSADATFTTPDEWTIAVWLA